MANNQRLLPSLVDEIAQSDPHRILYSIPKTHDLSTGFQDIDATTFARAVNRCSWYLEKHLGRGQAFPTLTYMGPQDLIYPILTLASIKTGYKLLLNSPRNTLEAHISLFEKTNCGIFLLPPNFALPAVKQILATRQMRVLDIPSVQYWLEEGTVEPYPYTKSFADARSEPFVVLHTSGSTGVPKPIIQTHGTLSPLDAFMSLSSQGQKLTYPAMCTGKRVYLAFPLFHCAGLSMILPGCLYAGFTVVLGPFPPSAQVANAVQVYGNVQHSCLAPATLVDLVKNAEYLRNLGRLEQVTFGGGPLPQAVGDVIIRETRLLNCLGTTECGVLPVQLCDLEDWAYMSVSTVLGHEYRHVSEDLYEQVIVRKPALEPYQGIFATFPDLTEWPMKDLYFKHPSKENVWLYRGRADDIIVFSTGEKINPLEMESVIDANPVVNVALVTGLGRFQSSLLVEAVRPPNNEAEKAELLEAIWPSIVAANKLSPSHGRIHQNMVLFTSAEKPMPRAGKGTVQRRPTVDLYSTELDSLYKENEAHLINTESDINVNQGNLEDTMKRIIASCTDIAMTELTSTADLFELGLDSLQVMLVAKRINEYLSEHGKPPSMEARLVYSNPSIGALISIVSALREEKSFAGSGENAEQRMKKLYELHTANLPISARPAVPKRPGEHVVLLTGSTGSLGSYILDSLLADSDNRKIYCLNRGTGTLERQKKSQSSRGLEELSSRARCLDADISKPKFGLSNHEYRDLLNEVTVVIHNAWQVDFNIAVSSFGSQIETVRRFVDFSAHSKFGAQLVFVSSISAVSNWHAGKKTTEDIPELLYEDWNIPAAIGYGQAKFVAERILDAAAREADIPAVVCRVGQIAGPTKTAGMWPKQEWLPSLIRSSQYLGKVPASLGTLEVVDWVPVDMLARVIVELTTTSAISNSGGATVYHAVSPQRTSWKQLLPTVVRCLAPITDIQTVSLKDWVVALRESEAKEDMEKNPAIKILGFFEYLASDSAQQPVLLDTKNAVSMSSTLTGLGPLKEEWVENWMRQWAF